MDDRHLIWRATLRPTPGLQLRLITWDLQFRENEVAVRADLDRERDIRLLNRPQDLLNLSAANRLCLEQFLHPKGNTPSTKSTTKASSPLSASAAPSTGLGKSIKSKNRRMLSLLTIL